MMKNYFFRKILLHTDMQKFLAGGDYRPLKKLFYGPFYIYIP